MLNRLREWADGRPKDQDDTTALRAVAAVLQQDDAGRLGRDRVTGIVGLMRPVFQQNEPLAFASHALTAFLDHPNDLDVGDRGRLRILLLEAAFESGLQPRDLLDLWDVAPALGWAMSAEPRHRLGLLYGAWASRHRMPQGRDAVRTVFEVCRSAPYQSREWTAAYPDLLFVYRAERDLDETLGPIFVCGRGIVVGGQVTANPSALVEARRLLGGSGRFELTVGAHRYETRVRPGAETVRRIRGLLQFRHDVLLPYADRYLNETNPLARGRLLNTLGRRCHRCGVVSAAAAGRVGVELLTAPISKR